MVLFLGLVGGVLPARGQCLPLSLLTQATADGQPATVAGIQAQLPAAGWEAHPAGAVAGTSYWLFAEGPSASAGEKALPTRLELRRSNQDLDYDVVYKTTRKDCFGALRAELRRAGLKHEPVTCPQCEAERYSGPNYSVTLYSQAANFAAGKAPYPFVVVMHGSSAADAGLR